MQQQQQHHHSGCLICGAELVYTTEPRTLPCVLCGKEAPSNAACGNGGHFVCDACHAGDALDFVQRMCVETQLTDPLAIATVALDLPSTSLHGPEHHFIVPAALAAAYLNATGADKQRKEDVLKQIRARAQVIPGGFCGFGGCCGGAAGAGIFVAAVASSTPLKTKEWAAANEAMGRALCSLSAMGGPRCCKRTTFNSLVVAAAVAEKRLGVKLHIMDGFPVCHHFSKNAQCIGPRRCPFHPRADQAAVRAQTLDPALLNW